MISSGNLLFIANLQNTETLRDKWINKTVKAYRMYTKPLENPLFDAWFDSFV